MEPFISICTITYNHASYIRQCIDGFLMQKTIYSFEVLIHDDASTDGTEEIIREYEAKYPEIIKPLYEKENQWVKGRRGSSVFNFPRARGKYIALCEGDDYWTDPLKLQKQVGFLEKNPEYSLCFHNAEIRFVDKRQKPHSFANYTKNIYTIEDIIRKSWFIPTQSIVFKKDLYESPEWNSRVTNGDYTLQLLIADKGPFYCLNEIMSVYRKHKYSLNATHRRDFFPFKIIQILLYFDYYSNFKYNSLIWSRIEEIKGTIYKKNLYDRPLISRLFSLDYYFFKILSVMSKKY